MTNLLIFIHVAIVFVYEGIIAYTQGFWFWLAHPVQFIGFVQEWKQYKSVIEQRDLVNQSGYDDLNRRQRRKLARITS